MHYLKYLLSELRRRKVFGVAAAYALVAWAIIEVASTVLQMAEAPPWIAKLVLAMVATGFPIAIVLAWFFDLSATGFVRTPSAPADGSVPSRGVPVLALLAVLAISAVVTAFAIWLRPEAHPAVEFTQLTNFADAASAPALSPDGKMLAFLKGQGFFGNSATPSQVYVKQLPEGQEVQLTNTRAGKATPTFSLDGSRIYFTSVDGNFDWGTHVVSVNGGHDAKVLPNASGLTFLDAENVLFASVKRGTHMGMRRGTLAREGVREVYWPGEDGMAHRAAASPDRKWALIVEMDAGVWQPCRLVPLDGSSTGQRVGPLASQCSYAAWSADGRWMFFTSNAGGTFHIWRQRFPDGEPEQVTNGPTEEEGIAVAPDGSLITSAGVRHNSIWLMDDEGERQISVESYAFSPVASRDGKRVYFLSRAGIARLAYHIGNLVAVTIAGGAREEVLPGHRMVHFDISSDDRMIAFVSGDDRADRRGIWVAPLDGSAAPRRIHPGEAERVFLDPARNVYFLARVAKSRYLHRLRAPDYTVNERVYSEPTWYIFSISPGGEWVVVNTRVREGIGMQQVAVSTRTGTARSICGRCGGGAGPARVLAPAVSWTRDGHAFLVSAQFAGPAAAQGLRPQYTIVVPLPSGATLPDLPVTGITSVDDYLKLPGARRVAKANVLTGATPDQLFFYEATTIRNLYRVRLPD